MAFFLPSLKQKTVRSDDRYGLVVSIHRASFFVLGRNTALYFSLLILFFYRPMPYDIHVPNDRYMRNDEMEVHYTTSTTGRTLRRRSK